MHHLLQVRAHRILVALLLTLVCAAGPLRAARPAAAAAVTFTVTVTKNFEDLAPGDGVCDVSDEPGRQCSLAAAIQEANATSDRDTIAFHIPGPGVHTIRVLVPMPSIIQPVIIDGYTQPGATPNTATTGTNAALRIELDGTGAADVTPGLTIAAPNSVVKGLIVNRFAPSSNGLIVDPGGRNARIEGCFIGTNAGGTVDRGNHLGVVLQGENNVLGGPAPAARNLISGNTVGVLVLGAGNRVEGNLIGTTKDGVGDLGNGNSGVAIASGAGNVVGGTTAAAANTIAFNANDGVTISNNATGNRVLRNAIFENGGLGIDLSDDGVTANDPGDADTGPNNLQNRPVLDAAVTSGTSTVVEGRLNSGPAATFVLRFFSNPPGGTEGRVFRGQLSVTTNGAGNVAFTFTSPTTIPNGQTVTATATNAVGDTSEFSLPTVV